MTEPTYICLGRIGDVMITLQCLHAKGGRPKLMVQREYASLLDGVSYVEPVVYDGDVNDIAGAVKAAGGPVVVTQVASHDADALRKHVYEPRGLPGARTDSFVKEIYDCCGMLKDYRRNLPLVFDRRDAEREAALVAKLPKRKKLIGVAVDGVTSPFPYKPLLMELLRGRFSKGYAVMDLGATKAERFYDMLGVLEKLDVLVAGDSAMLHLATALPNLPVCALTQDKPSLWHGSAWRPQHIWYCRYGDFAERALGLLNSVDWLPHKGDPIGCRIVHIYQTANEAEICGMPGKAWNILPITKGMFGRDSHYSPLKDEKRFPFLRDVVRAAWMAAGDDDVIVMTRNGAMLEGGKTELLLTSAPCYAHRVVRGKDGYTWSAQVDLFAFTKGFWDAITAEVPEMVMGRDPYWSRVLMEIMRSHGAKEVKNVCYRVEAE